MIRDGISKAVGGAIGTAAQTGALASIGTVICVAAGIEAAHRVVGKAETHAAGATTFEKRPSLGQIVSLGLVAADRAVRAGFHAFDAAVSRRFAVPPRGGEVSLAEAEGLTDAEHFSFAVPQLDAILGGFYGPDHQASLRKAMDVIEYGTHPQVMHLQLRLLGLADQGALQPLYAAIRKRFHG